jgi:hypothetical protein
VVEVREEESDLIRSPMMNNLAAGWTAWWSAWPTWSTRPSETSRVGSQDIGQFVDELWMLDNSTIDDIHGVVLAVVFSPG